MTFKIKRLSGSLCRFKGILFLCLFISFFSKAQVIDPHPEQLQDMFDGNLKKAYGASVFLVNYDTLSRKISGTRFSGVVVSESGLILTAGHASRPGNIFLVQFPDDKKEYIAVGLGRIALFDAAMVQIKGASGLPYAELGWSSSLKVNEPCFSVAYPGSFNPKRAVIRFGYVAELSNGRKFTLRTTCAMEPGDSGGPVFDLYGRVIGIRSNILQKLEDNFDVPADIFRKYWSALQKPENYQFLPAGEDIGVDPLAAKRTYYSKPKGLASSLSQSRSSLHKFSVQLVNNQNLPIANGTVVDVRGLDLTKKHSKKTYVITKSSLVGDSVYLKEKPVSLGAKIVYRDNRSDLALLQFEKKSKAGIRVENISTDSLKAESLGDLLIAPKQSDDYRVGVLGTLEFDIPGLYSRAYLGLLLVDRDDRKVVNAVVENSPAGKAGIKVGDELVSLNGHDLKSVSMFTQEIQVHNPNDVILLSYLRNGLTEKLSIKLGKRASTGTNTIADHFEGGKSERFDGFKHVFAHDTPVLASECGGPLFDFDNNFRGINIARYSRTTSLAIPSGEVVKFLNDAIKALNPNVSI